MASVFACKVPIASLVGVCSGVCGLSSCGSLSLVLSDSSFLFRECATAVRRAFSNVCLSMAGSMSKRGFCLMPSGCVRVFGSVVARCSGLGKVASLSWSAYCGAHFRGKYYGFLWTIVWCVEFGVL